MAKKERGSLSGKIDGIFRSIFFPGDGKSRSTLLLYSFCLSLAFIAVIVSSYAVLLSALETAFQNSSVTVRNVIEYTIPAIIGCIPCLALSFEFRRDKMVMVPLAFIWVSVITLIMCVTMMFAADKNNWKTEYGMFMTLIGLPMIISSALGTIGSQIIYRIRRNSQGE